MAKIVKNGTMIFSENEKSNYVQQIHKVLGIYKYAGCLVTPINGKFKALGKTFDTPKEAEAAINNSFKNWKV